VLAERRMVGEANARRADAVEPDGAWLNCFRSVGANERSAVRNIRGLAVDDGGIPPQFDTDFARQPVLSSAISSFALLPRRQIAGSGRVTHHVARQYVWRGV
jgi:hypothetical protein